MNTSTRSLALVPLFAALLAVFGLVPKIDLPLGVPVTLQTVGVMLAGCLLGPWRGLQAIGLFLVAVAAGLPLLSGGRGGIGGGRRIGRQRQRRPQPGLIPLALRRHHDEPLPRPPGLHPRCPARPGGLPDEPPPPRGAPAARAPNASATRCCAPGAGWSRATPGWDSAGRRTNRSSITYTTGVVYRVSNWLTSKPPTTA